VTPIPLAIIFNEQDDSLKLLGNTRMRMILSQIFMCVSMKTDSEILVRVVVGSGRKWRKCGDMKK
jgi:hypothetical protein